MFSSKAETLSALSKRKLIFKIPNLNYYTYKDWKINKKKILNSIQKNYNNKLIALRSSAIDEDNLKHKKITPELKQLGLIHLINQWMTPSQWVKFIKISTNLSFFPKKNQNYLLKI